MVRTKMSCGIPYPSYSHNALRNSLKRFDFEVVHGPEEMLAADWLLSFVNNFQRGGFVAFSAYSCSKTDIFEISCGIL